MFGIGSLASYESYDQVGEGTYGYVFRAKDKRTGDQVALKRLIFHKESAGFPLCAVREIKFLKSLNHKNIVALKEIVTSKGCEHLDSNVSKKSFKHEGAELGAAVAGGGEENKKESETTIEPNKVVQLCGNMYLVFEYIDHDLGGLVDSKYIFSQRSIKCIAKQLFEALDYLNEKKVIHRDIKTSNILLSNRHQLKLADFGLARSSLSSDGREGKIDLTNNVVTMWYKAPELLLGATRYTNAIDIWSAGCVLAELELGRPTFPGKTELEQFDLTCKILGTPTEENWMNMTSLPNYESFLVKNNNQSNTKYPNIFRTAYDKKINEQALTLLERIFVFDPERRSSPKIILTNNYFFTHPLPPTNPSDLEPLQLTPGSSLHEYETKLKRKMQANVVATAAIASATEASTAVTVQPTILGSSTVYSTGVPVPPPAVYCLPSATTTVTQSIPGQQQYMPMPMGFPGATTNTMVPPPFNPVAAAAVGFVPPPPSFATSSAGVAGVGVGGNTAYAYGGGMTASAMPVPPPFRPAVDQLSQQYQQPPSHFSTSNTNLPPYQQQPQHWGQSYAQPLPSQQEHQSPRQPLYQQQQQPPSFQKSYVPPPRASSSTPATSTTASTSSAITTGYSPADAMFSQQALGIGATYGSSSSSSSNYGGGMSQPPNKMGRSSGVCDFFSQFGNCTKGDQCKFAHITPGQEGSSGGGEFNRPSYGQNNSSSFGGGSGEVSSGINGVSGVICTYFSKYGNCTKGDQCRHRHIAGKIDAGVCYAFQKGECNRGTECRYSHEEGGAAAGSTGGFTAGGSGGAGICYAFQKGECNRGAECRFSHQQGGVGTGGGGFGAGSAGVCYAFQKGECYRGTECRYSHQGSGGGGASGPSSVGAVGGYSSSNPSGYSAYNNIVPQGGVYNNAQGGYSNAQGGGYNTAAQGGGYGYHSYNNNNNNNNNNINNSSSSSSGVGIKRDREY